MEAFKKGDVVRPAADGIKHAWSRLRGIVIDAWMEGAEQRVEIQWNHPSGRSYGTRVPSYLLEEVK